MIAGLSLSPVWAQDPPAEDPHAGHNMTPSPTAPSNDGGDGGAEEAGGTSGEQSDAGMDMRGMQGGSPPPDARDPHAYSGGQEFIGPIKAAYFSAEGADAFLDLIFGKEDFLQVVEHNDCGLIYAGY